MKTNTVVRIISWVFALFVASPGMAEDTDIFAPQADFEPGVPTIIFVLDNTSNWSRLANGWPSGTQGAAEMNAISSIVGSLEKPVNIGLMMLTTKTNTSNNVVGVPDGAYVRFAARPMLDENGDQTAANTALRTLAALIAPNVNNDPEKVNTASGVVANAMYEAWLYITGSNSWAGMDKSADYGDNPYRGTGSNQIYPPSRIESSLGGWAYASGSRNARYNPPPMSGCGNTYIVFIGNNRQGQGASAFPSPLPGQPSVTTLNSYSGYNTPANGYIAATWARFLRLRPDLGAGSEDAIGGAVITYTIDAYNDQQNLAFSEMLRDMARQGGGESYRATNEGELLNALNTIVTKILAVNSVFASVALPVSVNQRGSYLNQVYLGVFRPDAERAPNWAGNLKQYQIAVQTINNVPNLYLADASDPPVAAANGNFISPTAKSFWTSSSSFWSPTYYVNSQGVSGASDSPDGQLVEKGAVAQKLRTAYATSLTDRDVYTCTSGCSANSLLSGTPFDTSNASITQGAVLAANPTERDAIINWARGANNRLDDNPSNVATDVRGFIHGDVVHSRPVVINYNRSADDVFVFYGANDGMFRAIKGGQGNGGGVEQWAFTPEEGFGRLKRLRDHAPLIGSANPKPYFLDGSPTVYTFSSANDGTIDPTQTGDKAYLYLPARRGGRFIYALNVTDPTAPRLLWKKTNASSGFSELGQTWSELKLGRIRGQTDPVAIFGLGYDPAANDSSVTPAEATMGRGVMIINAFTGAKIWSTEDAAGSYRNGINQHSIAAAVAQVDTNYDGYVDRIIAADTGGNIWRINVDYTDPDTNPNNDPGQWTIDKLANLGGSSSNARKFLGAPDFVVASSSGVPVPYDAILIGSGDREHPFDATITNRFYMIKDEHAKNHRYTSALTERDLYDATENLIQDGDTTQRSEAVTSLTNSKGWYITLLEGEKVVGPSTTLSGATFFGTNTPNTGDGNSCVANLGTARTYAVSYLDASAIVDLYGANNGQNNGTIELGAADRSQVIPGGGFPPAPVALQVDVNNGSNTQSYQGVAFGTQILQPPGAGFGRRFRVWWYQNKDD